MSYEAGDHVAIRPVNSNLEVDRFLRVLGLDNIRHKEITITASDPSINVPVPQPTTYDSIARYYLDICAPVSRQLLAIAAAYAPYQQAKLWLQRLSSEEAYFETNVSSQYLNFAKLLESRDTADAWTQIPFSAILEQVPVMKPRYYSISSSSLADKGTISITTVVQSRHSPGMLEEFRGVATHYISALATSLLEVQPTPLLEPTHIIGGPRDQHSNPTAFVSVRRSKFKLPSDASIPVIMIGPGTGVAPFRGFVQSRIRHAEQGKQVGRTMLFYGCRSQQEDFLYKEEWQLAAEKLTPDVFSMHVALSRQQGVPKSYVQDLFTTHADELRDLILAQGAYVYVCGDAQRMAKDVYKRMSEVVVGAGAGGDQPQEHVTGSGDVLDDMKATGRWLEDVW